MPTAVQSRLLSAGRTGRWTRAELLFHPEDSAETVMLLTRGAVRLYRLSSGMREVTLDVHGPGDLLGLVALEPSVTRPTLGMYAEAADDTEALLVGAEALLRLLEAEPTLGPVLTEQLTRQTRAVQERLSHLVFLEVSQRLALALLTLAGREGEWTEAGTLALRERVSHQDLAHMVGSTRETITKLLGDFRNRGLLDLGYRRIVLTDQAGLERAARESRKK